MELKEYRNKAAMRNLKNSSPLQNNAGLFLASSTMHIGDQRGCIVLYWGRVLNISHFCLVIVILSAPLLLEMKKLCPLVSVPFFWREGSKPTSK